MDTERGSVTVPGGRSQMPRTGPGRIRSGNGSGGQHDAASTHNDAWYLVFVPPEVCRRSGIGHEKERVPE